MEIIFISLNQMLHHPPKLSYSGLTVVLSNPSRFDRTQLLTATGGNFFLNDCLYPHFNRYQLDIRTLENKEPYLPGTNCVLALGEQAIKMFPSLSTSLGEQRGSPIYTSSGIPVIFSYLPQDTQDIKDYESEFNPLLNLSSEDSERDADKLSAQDEKRRHGKTSRKHWAFWLQKDVEKAIILTQNNGKPPSTYDNTETSYIIYPPSESVISLLTSTKNQDFYFDIETDANLNITCFAFGFALDKIYVVPVIRHDYSYAYPNISNIFHALAICIRDNCAVAHNGAGFDFFVLAHKYRIPIGKRVYDTMLAQNRIYPEIEKSLGHCISLPWMFEPYHKDEGNFSYGTEAQAAQLWRYCGKDVSSLIRLKKAQTDYAKTKIGIRSSIDSVNSYIRPYLCTMLLGIRYDKSVLEKVMDENDKLMNQYIRMLELLIGKENLKTIRGSGKSAMPGSPKQCVRYFHEMLNYAVVARTDEGNPKLDAKAMFKLKLKIENPVIDVILAYRRCSKESGSLKFIPWKDNVTTN